MVGQCLTVIHHHENLLPVIAVAIASLFCFLSHILPYLLPFPVVHILCPALFHSYEHRSPFLIQPLSPSSSCHSIDASDQQSVAGDSASRSGLKPDVSGRLPGSDLPVTASGGAQHRAGCPPHGLRISSAAMQSVYFRMKT